MEGITENERKEENFIREKGKQKNRFKKTEEGD